MADGQQFHFSRGSRLCLRRDGSAAGVSFSAALGILRGRGATHLPPMAVVLHSRREPQGISRAHDAHPHQTNSAHACTVEPRWITSSSNITTSTAMTGLQIVGLFTSTAYVRSTRHPHLRSKVANVMARRLISRAIPADARKSA
jgi:hypothetical protein